MYEKIFDLEDMIKLQEFLRINNKSITVAESCTGGLIASMITEISGSSDIFDGSIVSYSNEIKIKELNVKKENLEKFGSVSIQVVEDMLENVMEKFNADYAIATSGIAGPTGATKTKPVGTVVIGVAYKNGLKDIDFYHFSGNRREFQIKVSKYAFKKFSNFLKKTLDK